MRSGHLYQVQKAASENSRPCLGSAFLSRNPHPLRGPLVMDTRVVFGARGPVSAKSLDFGFDVPRQESEFKLCR